MYCYTSTSTFICQTIKCLNQSLLCIVLMCYENCWPNKIIQGTLLKIWIARLQHLHLPWPPKILKFAGFLTFCDPLWLICYTETCLVFRSSLNKYLSRSRKQIGESEFSMPYFKFCLRYNDIITASAV